MARSTDVSVHLGRALALPLAAALGLSAALAWRAAGPATDAEAPLRLPRVQDGPRDGNVALAAEPPPAPGRPERPLRAAVGGRLSAAPLVLASGGPLAHHGLQLALERVEGAAERLGRLRRGEVDVALVPLSAWADRSVGQPFLLAGWSRGLEGLQGQPAGRVGVVGAEGAWLWRALGSVRPGLRGKASSVVLQGAGEAERLRAEGALAATVGPLPAWPEEAPLATSAELPGGVAEVWVAAPGLQAQAPGALAALGASSWDALSVLAEDPAAAHAQLSGWAGRPVEEVRGELARWHLAGFSDNALFFGLTGGASTFDALVAGQVAAGLAGAAGLGATPRGDSPGATVASLSHRYRGLPWAQRFALRDRPRLAQRSLPGQGVLLHFAQGGRGLLPGDGLLLEGLAETLREFPGMVLQVAPSAVESCAAWLRAELRRGYGVAPDRVVPRETPPPPVPPAEAPSACAVQLQPR